MDNGQDILYYVEGEMYGSNNRLFRKNRIPEAKG